MKNDEKLFWYYLGISVFLFLVLAIFFGVKTYDMNKEFNSKITEQQTQINTLTETLNSDFMVLQSLIINQANESRKADNDLKSIIARVESESKGSIAKTKQELQKEISTIETTGADFSKVIQASLPAVVSVLTDAGQGSGAIISEDGKVITNYHVISGARRINVATYDKETYPTVVLGYDKDIDVALLKINFNETFNMLELGDSDLVKVGEGVVALGNPFGLDFTATQGIISAKRRASNGLDYIQIDVPINPGNSGGPIIDSTGKIIGLANFRIQGGEGLGFALPSNTIQEVIDNIRG